MENGWSRYEKMVLDKLEGLETIREEQILIRIELGKLKVKAGLWGGVVGAIPVIGAVIAYFFTKNQ